MSATLEMVANTLPTSYSPPNKAKMAGPQKGDPVEEPQLAGPVSQTDLAPENRVEFAGNDLGASPENARDEGAPQMIDVFA